jgi:hypothetical protein
VSWSDELDRRPEPERQTGLDWIYTISESDQSKVDRRMDRARRKLDRAEGKYHRRMRKTKES